MNAQSLVQSFQYTAHTIHLQLSNITHADSLKQPITNGYTIHWLLGHIVSARSVPLQRIDAKPVWDEQTRARYRSGSVPIITDAPDVLRLSDLMLLFDLTHDRLTNGLAQLTDEQLRADSGYGDNTVFESFLYFHFHETYHVGQMTMIAEALGYPASYPL